MTYLNLQLTEHKGDIHNPLSDLFNWKIHVPHVCLQLKKWYESNKMEVMTEQR